jgi:hypothetical protein
MDNVRIGLFGIGLDPYRSQFIALEERLEGYVGEVRRKLGCPAIKVEKLGRLQGTETVRECSRTGGNATGSPIEPLTSPVPVLRPVGRLRACGRCGRPKGGATARSAMNFGRRIANVPTAARSPRSHSRSRTTSPHLAGIECVRKNRGAAFARRPSGAAEGEAACRGCRGGGFASPTRK